MEKKKIQGHNTLIKNYGICATFFLVVTLSILLWNNGIAMVTTCIVRYGMAMIILMLAHYYFVVKHKRIEWKKLKHLKRFSLAGVLIIGISFIGVKLLVYFNLIRGFSKRYFLVFMICGLILYLLFACFVKKEISENKMIALTIFLIGTLYTYCLPLVTGVSWDDQIHFARVLQISQLGSTEFTKADIANISNTYEGGAPKLLDENSYSEFVGELNKKYQKNEKEAWTYEKLSVGVMIAYLPSVLMIVLGRGLSLPYNWLYLFGKWGNVIFYSIIIYYVLKRLKSGKVLVFIISMLPTTLFLMANYSYDTWGISLSMLGYAHIIGNMQEKDKKLGYKETIIICIIFLLAFSAKPIYFCMALLPLCIPKEKFKEKCSVVKCRLLFVLNSVLLVGSFVLPFFMSGSGGNDMRGGTDVNSMEQIKFILTNPIEYTEILLRFLWQYWSPENSNVYVHNFAYIGGFVNIYPILIISILFYFLDKREVDLHITKITSRVWAFLLAFINSVFVATSLYVAYTPVGLNTINGCQARYLLPLLFCVIYYLGDFRFISKIDRFINRKVLTSSAVIVYAFYAVYTLIKLCIIRY